MELKEKQTTSVLKISLVIFSVLCLTGVGVALMLIYFKNVPSIPLAKGDIVVNSSIEQQAYTIALNDISNAQELFSKEIIILTPKEEGDYIIRAKIINFTDIGADNVGVNIKADWVKGEDGFYYCINSVQNNKKIPFASGIKIEEYNTSNYVDIIVQALVADKNVEDDYKQFNEKMEAVSFHFYKFVLFCS